MKLVEVIKPWTDSQLNRKTVLGEFLEVDDERAEVLLSHPERIARSVTGQDLKTARLLGKHLAPPLKSPAGLKDESDKEKEKKEKEPKKPTTSQIKKENETNGTPAKSTKEEGKKSVKKGTKKKTTPKRRYKGATKARRKPQ